jgi:hypothetical protein
MTTRMTKLASFAASIGIASALLLPSMTIAQAAPLTNADLGVDTIGGSIKLGGGDVRTTAARIINVSLGFLGIIAVAIVLLGGFKYMVSGGNTEKTEDARKLIVSGIIGLAIILSAWAITGFVINNLINATNQG